MKSNDKMKVVFKKDSITHEPVMYICIVQKIFEISFTNYIQYVHKKHIVLAVM